MTDLTERQTQVLEARMAGETQKRIAARLGLSIRAVASHEYRALLKLHTHDLALAARRWRALQREALVRATT